jgi:hypothetical protein
MEFPLLNERVVAFMAGSGFNGDIRQVYTKALAEFAAYIAVEITRGGEVVRKGNIKAE